MSSTSARITDGVIELTTENMTVEFVRQGVGEGDKDFAQGGGTRAVGTGPYDLLT